MKRALRKVLTPGLLRLLKEGDGERNVYFKMALALLALVLVLCLVLPDRPNIFTVDTATELVAFTVTDPTLSQWELGGARVLTDPLQPAAEAGVLAPDTVLDIAPGTRVRLQRHGVGILRIELEAGEAAGSVGSLDDPAGGTRSLGDWALLLVEVEGRPRLLPFRGRLTVGDDVASGVNSVLLSGTVSVVEEQLFGRSRYVAGSGTLDPGDRIQLWGRNANTGTLEPVVVNGFVRAEPMEGFSEPVNAMQLVAHGQAEYVQVERLGSAGYRIRAQHWARFVNDPVLAALTAIVALLILLIEFLSRCLVQLLGAPLVFLARRLGIDETEGTKVRAGEGGGE
ncbi:hypothetical protein [Thiohalobacter sp.]|uniref:hypothetical protein n=1 Tax=Thiohalobacter sp. TaxID=2025948 RepID=UPI0026210136|nr:hypothetical protein [Thiohalobacter sp.]